MSAVRQSVGKVLILLSVLTGCAVGPVFNWKAAAAAVLPGTSLISTGGSGARDAEAPLADSQGPTNSLAVLTRQIEAILPQTRARAQASESENPVGMPTSDAVVRRLLLHRLVRIYEQQLSDLTELQNAKSRRTELVQQARSWSKFSAPGPYSILLTDGLREGAQAERLRIQSNRDALSALDSLIVQNRSTLSLAEERIRRLNELLEGVPDAGRTNSLSWQRELEQIRSRVASAAVALLELERQIREEDLGASRAHLELLEKQLVIARSEARFTEEELEKVLGNLEADRVRLEHDLGRAELRRDKALAALETARQASSQLPATNSAPGAAALAAETVGTRTAEWEGALTEIRVLRLLLEADSIERSLWELRFAAYGSRRLQRLHESQRQWGALTERVALWKDYFRQKLDVSASQLELHESRLSQLGPDSELAPLVQERLTVMRERDESLLSMVRSAERLERLLQRWNEDLGRDIGNLPIIARVQNLFSSTRSFMGSLWSFELFTAEDTITVDGQKVSGKRSVTVGKVFGAILILVVGYWLTGLASEAGRRFIQRYLNVEPNQGELIRRWLRATLVVILVVFSLVSVKIPLTVFAFAGGALAIGIGFGTQTVLKNVVSGLIILFERPFGVGDVLDVGGQRGTLTSIGLRASVLQSWDSTETLFPNSQLLESALTNWTFSNRIVRFSITVGVAFGSDTRRVVQVLESVLSRHGQLEKNPSPLVLFAEFGPSALVFEVRFWLDVIKTNAAQVSSDLRHMIVGAFTENGITIAFPQQDVHLDTTRPLHLEVVTAKQPPSPPPSDGLPRTPLAEPSQN